MRESPLARILFAVFAVLTVYASLYPMEGWRGTGVSPLAYLTAPWPRHITSFDIVVNVLGYIPFGFLAAAALQPRVHGGRAFIVATASAAVLSLILEALQSYLPARFASNVDAVCNVLGAVLGAAAVVRCAAGVRGRSVRAAAAALFSGGRGDRPRPRADGALALHPAQPDVASFRRRGPARIAGGARAARRASGVLHYHRSADLGGQPHRRRPASVVPRVFCRLGARADRDARLRRAGGEDGRFRHPDARGNRARLAYSRRADRPRHRHRARAWRRRAAARAADDVRGAPPHGGDGARQPRAGQSLPRGVAQGLAAGALPQLQRPHAPRERALALRRARVPDVPCRQPAAEPGAKAVESRLHVLLREARFLLLQPARRRPHLLQRQGRERDAGLRQVQGQGAWPFGSG